MIMEKIVMKLGEISKLINGDRGKNYPSQNDIVDDGEIPFINAGHLIDNQVNFDVMNYISREKFDKLSSGKVNEGDILYCLRGSLGKKALVRNINDGAIASSLVIIRPDRKRVSSEYLLLALESSSIKSQLIKANNGSSQPNLSAKSVSDYSIKLHSIDKQEEIIGKVNKAKSIIDSRKLQLALLDDLIKSRFVEMFGDILNSEFKTVVLKDIANIGSSKRIYANEYVSTGIPFYRSKEIRELGNGEKPSIELFISEERYNEIKETYGIPSKGDILIAAIGATIGYMWIVNTDSPFYYKDGNLILISNIKAGNAIFFQEVLKQVIEEYKRTGVAGSAQLALTIEKVEKMRVPIPPIDLQNQFADFVLQVDKLKFEAQESLNEMQQLFDSLMQRYFG